MINVETASAIDQTEVEVLIIGIPDHPENVEGFDLFVESFHPLLPDWIKSQDVQQKFKTITKMPALSKQRYDRVYFVGVGNQKRLTEQPLRELFAEVGKQLNQDRVRTVGVWIAPFCNEEINSEDVAFLASEGIGMGSYTYEGFKTSSNEVDISLTTVTFITTEDEERVTAAGEVGMISAHAVNEARTLVNVPPNLLTPTKMAEYAQELAESYDLEIDILGKAEMEELGMGAILAVNQGSVEEPKLIVLKYQATEQWEDVVGLVGKGITYDTGGYSLKPKDGMVGMKGDMGGAAAVLGAMAIIGESRPKKNVMAVIASSDNMISGEAFKPDDVITSLSGKTIEVLNTDAEGRLVLADAVTYAKQAGAEYLIDVATLTGGVIVALGNDKTGTLTNDDAFYKKFQEAADETGEFIWQLPLTESDRKRIRKSDVADVNNSPGRDGHMIFGGGFVGEFVGDTPWIHLDIAGTSDAASPHALGPKGATGVMVRTLATFVERLAAETEQQE
ncbi:leucyl aminopeptidase [Sporosarcina sp. P21c]|uniref:leucyl aminopeptidase n=1 Tax=unclassified Sporosarcina TaxID=2647733 RepID=UPI000C16ED4C|nr:MULTISPECIES: leucyl aminopeptidase [unclassified Sporosarcina]PIC66604.1 leucyl aminopeptidase [Sporosarcina sp. P16a]PIC88757.1 leucyl aminopeptidase [Sporosarcina sp. P21c]PIC91767.1 leucyl aminopeptidase [Sporosarcina sp. P25]